MKKLFLMLIILPIFCSTVSIAQTLEVEYLNKLKLDETTFNKIKNPIIRQMVKKKLQNTNTIYKLTSRNGISLYKLFNVNSAENSSENVEYKVSDDIVYLNQKKNLMLKQTTFLNRLFLIKDTIVVQNWKLSDETKNIGKYLCKKATTEMGNSMVTAWFTEEIPSNVGPYIYNGLPGLILEVETNSQIYSATKVSFSDENIEIFPPQKGKIVSREEFRKIQKERGRSSKKSDKGIRVEVIDETAH